VVLAAVGALYRGGGTNATVLAVFGLVVLGAAGMVYGAALGGAVGVMAGTILGISRRN
jgi:hypothetical protein